MGISIDPFDGFGHFVVLADITHEFSLQIGHRSKDATSNDIALNFSEPQFHLIKPGGIGRRIVDRNGWMLTEKLLNFLGLVG